MILQGSVFLTFSEHGCLELGFASGIKDAREPQNWGNITTIGIKKNHPHGLWCMSTNHVGGW